MTGTAGRTERNLKLGLLVFVVGAASLGTEIAVARLLAPFFGASTIIWANTIGVVVVALAIGYWLGGRFADRHSSLRGLCLVVAVAAGLLAAAPFAARPFLGFSVTALSSIQAGAFLGSLLAVLILVVVPLMLLGAVTPYALRLAVSDIQRSGEVAGRLYAVSTAGSLVGTMLAALVLIPLVGTQRTFLIFASALALVALLGLGWRFLLGPAVLVVLVFLAAGAIKSAADGHVLFEDETPYRYVRVVERPDHARILELNEGQAVHSLYLPGRYLTGNYWDGFLVLPFSAAPERPRRVLLGSAAGTVARAYGHFCRRPGSIAVEIDGELTARGHRYFGLHNRRMHVYTADARTFLAGSDRHYDTIMIDAYRQPYIPFYLITREFFELAQQHLAPGGTVIVNVGHPEGTLTSSASWAARWPSSSRLCAETRSSRSIRCL